MNTNHNKIAITIGALAASGLLTLAVPTGTSQAIAWKPPMPCVAVDAGLYPVGAGFCHGTTSRPTRKHHGRTMEHQAPVTSTHRTSGPT